MLLQRSREKNNERKWKDKQILGFCQRVEEVGEHEGDGTTNCNWGSWNSLQEHEKEDRMNKGSEEQSITFRPQHSKINRE